MEINNAQEELSNILHLTETTGPNYDKTEKIASWPEIFVAIGRMKEVCDYKDALKRDAVVTEWGTGTAMPLT